MITGKTLIDWGFTPGSKFGGRVIDLHEGATWKAHDLETALRALRKALGSGAYGDEDDNQLEEAKDLADRVIAELNKIPGPEDFKDA